MCRLCCPRPLASTWCCWLELKKGTLVSAIYGMITCLADLGVGAWAIFYFHAITQKDTGIDPNVYQHWYPTGAQGLIYIEFIFAIIGLFLSAFLMMKMRKGYAARVWMWTWVGAFFLHRLFEFICVIYVLGSLGDEISTMAYRNPGMIAGLVFFCIDTGVIIFSCLAVYSYTQVLEDEYKRGLNRAKRALDAEYEENMLEQRQNGLRHIKAEERSLFRKKNETYDREPEKEHLRSYTDPHMPSDPEPYSERYVGEENGNGKILVVDLHENKDEYDYT